jgi:AbrB family looped-hinge helix DNA binding protein
MAIESIKVNENYPLTIPKEIRKEVSIEAGDEIEMVVNEKKEVNICRVTKVPIEDSFGIWRGEKAGLIM